MRLIAGFARLRTLPSRWRSVWRAFVAWLVKIRQRCALLRAVRPLRKHHRARAVNWPMHNLDLRNSRFAALDEHQYR